MWGISFITKISDKMATAWAWVSCSGFHFFWEINGVQISTWKLQLAPSLATIHQLHSRRHV